MKIAVNCQFCFNFKLKYSNTLQSFEYSMVWNYQHVRILMNRKAEKKQEENLCFSFLFLFLNRCMWDLSVLPIFLHELFRVIEVCEWRTISIRECFILDTACFAIRISNRSGYFIFILFYVLSCCAIAWLWSVCFVCLFCFFCLVFFSFLSSFSYCFRLFVFLVNSDWSAINYTNTTRRNNNHKKRGNNNKRPKNTTTDTTSVANTRHFSCNKEQSQESQKTRAFI